MMGNNLLFGGFEVWHGNKDEKIEFTSKRPMLLLEDMV
jgi:hypothetical protein